MYDYHSQARIRSERQFTNRRRHHSSGVVRQYFGSENFGFTVVDNLVPRTVDANNERTRTSSVDADRRRSPSEDTARTKLPESLAADKPSTEAEVSSREAGLEADELCGASAVSKATFVEQTKSTSSEKSAGCVEDEQKHFCADSDDERIRCLICKCRVLQEDFPGHYLAHRHHKRKSSQDAFSREPSKKARDYEKQDSNGIAVHPVGDDPMSDSAGSADDVIHPVPIRFEIPSPPLSEENGGSHSSYSADHCKAPETNVCVAAIPAWRLAHPAAPPMYSMPAFRMRHPADPVVSDTPDDQSYSDKEVQHITKQRVCGPNGSSVVQVGCGDVAKALMHPAVACQFDGSGLTTQSGCCADRATHHSKTGRVE